MSSPSSLVKGNVKDCRDAGNVRANRSLLLLTTAMLPPNTGTLPLSSPTLLWVVFTVPLICPILPAAGGALAAIWPTGVAMLPLAALWVPFRLPLAALALPLVGPPDPSGLLKAGTNFYL